MKRIAYLGGVCVVLLLLTGCRIIANSHAKGFSGNLYYIEMAYGSTEAPGCVYKLVARDVDANRERVIRQSDEYLQLIQHTGKPGKAYVAEVTARGGQYRLYAYDLRGDAVWAGDVGDIYKIPYDGGENSAVFLAMDEKYLYYSLDSKRNLSMFRRDQSGADTLLYQSDGDSHHERLWETTVVSQDGALASDWPSSGEEARVLLYKERSFSREIAGGSPVWLSATELGIVRDDLFYIYNTQEQTLIKQETATGDDVRLDETRKGLSLNVSEDGGYIVYATLRGNTSFDERFDYAIVSLESGERQMISLNHCNSDGKLACFTCEK